MPAGRPHPIPRFTRPARRVLHIGHIRLMNNGAGLFLAHPVRTRDYRAYPCQLSYLGYGIRAHRPGKGNLLFFEDAFELGPLYYFEPGLHEVSGK